MPLTDTAVRNAKSGATTNKLFDGGGLQLWVKPNGTKLWCLAFRDASGKQQKLSFGAYPDLSLADARTKRAEANTFEALATELLAKKKREGKASNTIGKHEWLYSLAGDSFGKRPIAEITPPEVLRVLQAVEAKGHLETARRMRSSIGEVFRFAIATGRVESDPTFALRGALAKPQVKHRGFEADGAHCAAPRRIAASGMARI